MSFATRLKLLRSKSKKSLQDVATEVGASKAHIWELEIGKSTNPSLKLITDLAKCFDVSVSELVGENPNSVNEKSDMIAMYRELSQLKESDLETIKMLMKHLAKKDS